MEFITSSDKTLLLNALKEKGINLTETSGINDIINSIKSIYTISNIKYFNFVRNTVHVVMRYSRSDRYTGSANIGINGPAFILIPYDWIASSGTIFSLGGSGITLVINGNRGNGGVEIRMDGEKQQLYFSPKSVTATIRLESTYYSDTDVTYYIAKM